MTLILGIALAVGCALTTNLGFLYKHRGARAAMPVHFRRPVLVDASAVLVAHVRTSAC